MEHEVSQTDIIINIVIQIINIAIFFFFFVKFAGNAISKSIQEKIDKEKKLADADAEYARLIADAENQKKALLDEALVHKNRIVAEGKALAEQEQHKILDQAARDAKNILDKASQDAELKGRDLEAHFEQGVKTTALSVVKKLFASDKKLQEGYLDSLVDEFTTSYKQ